MSDRIDLSADTWIDGEHLVTTSAEKATAWEFEAGFQVFRFSEWKDTYYVNRFSMDKTRKWRIPRATARKRYQYVEGEPWVRLNTIRGARPWLVCGCGLQANGPYLPMHRRAALVCDTAKQLCALYEWIGG